MRPTSRQSRRIAGLDAQEPPPADLSEPGTELRYLLAKDFRNGRALVDGDPSRQWHLDGTAPFDLSTLERTYSHLEEEEGDGIRRNLQAFECYVDENESGDEEEEEEEDDEEAEEATVSPTSKYGAVDDASMKLLPYPKLKQMVEESCVCRYCKSPVLLKQETFGIATNLYLVCQPTDKCFTVHQYALPAERLAAEMPSTTS